MLAISGRSVLFAASYSEFLNLFNDLVPLICSSVQGGQLVEGASGMLCSWLRTHYTSQPWDKVLIGRNASCKPFHRTLPNQEPKTRP